MCMKCTFLHICMPCSAGRGLFFRALGCGAHKGGALTPQGMCGSPPGSLVRALGAQSGAICQVITGSLSASPSLEGQWRLHKLRFLLLLHDVFITPSLKLSSSLLCGRHCTTAVAHRNLRFVTADGASMCACAMFCVDLGTRNEHKISREVHLVGCCAGGRTI